MFEDDSLNKVGNDFTETVEDYDNNKGINVDADNGTLAELDDDTTETE